MTMGIGTGALVAGVFGMNVSFTVSFGLPQLNYSATS